MRPTRPSTATRARTLSATFSREFPTCDYPILSHSVCRIFSTKNIHGRERVSVFQIATHEEVIPIPRLYEICEIARHHSDQYRIGRVIARPFEGTGQNFRRTTQRHDFSMKPPRTVLNAIAEAGFPVLGVGKIS